MKSGNRQARAIMRLRGMIFDASKFVAIGKAFSNFVASFVVGANLQDGHLEKIARSSTHQWPALRSNVGALTNRSFGTLRAQQLSR